MKTSLFLLVLLLSLPCFAYKQAEGFIKELYVNTDGSIALKLEGGFSSDVTTECPSHNGYAGVRNSDPIVKSMLLAAYTSKSKVKLGIGGCDSAWLKIFDVRGFN
ncbi:MAG: hypothetical protein U5M23_05010 [Marinagarivorans sp.]|nr:hypothetical protein [Marinagarivorans sp.]